MKRKRNSRKRPPAAIQRVQRMMDRLELATAIELQAKGDDDFTALALLLRSSRPEDKGSSPYTLARKLGIPFNDVIEAFKASKRMESLVAVAQRMPKVAEGIAIDAESSYVTCGACEGEGEVVASPEIGKRGEEGFRPAIVKRCIPCEGLGAILKPGDPTARKQVLEMMSLTGPHAVTINAPGANILNAGGGLEETLRSARRPVQPRPLEGEVVNGTD